MSSPLALEPGMVIIVWRPAGMITVPGKGAVTQRFASQSWDSRIGQPIVLYRKGKAIGVGKLVSAIVADNGCGVNLTYEVMNVAA